MRIKKFGVAAVLAIAILASTGTCFALKKSDMNIGGIYLVGLSMKFKDMNMFL